MPDITEKIMPNRPPIGKQHSSMNTDQPIKVGGAGGISACVGAALNVTEGWDAVDGGLTAA